MDKPEENMEQKPLKKIDSPLYNYFEALYMSFYSPELYVDVSKRWRGLGLLYLLLLLAILCIPLSIQGIQNFNKYFEEELIGPLRSLPTLYIRNGEVSLDYPEPYFVNNKRGEPVIMIDTKYTQDDFPEKYPTLNFIITKNRMMFRTPDPSGAMNPKSNVSGKSIYVQDIDPNVNEVFSGKTWVENTGILKLKIIGMVLVYPMMVFGFFGRLLVFLLALALLGQLFARVFHNTRLKFTESSRLLAVASTPMMLTLLVVFLLGINFKLIAVIYLVILSVYYFFAVQAVKKDRGKVVLL